MALAHLAARIFSTPLLIAPEKLEAILAAVGPRLGLDAIPAPGGPAVEPKARAPMEIDADAAIAVVQVVGSLSHRTDDIDAMSGMTSYQDVAADLERAVADPRVEGILLEVDSFGGEAAGCFDLADRIHAAAQKKPIFGVASQYAMSAGYALLSQASKVFVPQAGEVGSIGVVFTHVDVSAFDAMKGVRVTHVHAGARKADLSPHKALSPEARTRLEAEVGQLYETFLAGVGRGRGSKLDAEAARGTQALTYIGERAKAAGLADEVGDKDTARAALRAEIEEKRMSKQLQEENTALKAQLAVQGKTVAQLEAAVAQFKTAQAEQRKKDLDQVVDQLVLDCKAAGATPPDKAERDELRAGLDVSEQLGRKLVAAAREKHLSAVSKTTTKTLEPTGDEQRRKNFIAGVKPRVIAEPKDEEN